jgi:hypothetical protein
MPRYVLKDAGYPTFKKIMNGRKWIGRVCKTTTGYLGLIGPTQYRHPTERGAFDGVVAKHCGFDSPAAMDAQNRKVGAINRARYAEGQRIAQAMISGDFEPFAQMLERLDKESEEGQ